MGGERKEARIRRLQDAARARTRKLETALERSLSAARKAVSPEPDPAEAAAKAHSRFELNTYVHRQSGSRLRILDTLAADRPRHGLGSSTDAKGRELPFVVECLDHEGEPQHAASYKEATKLVRDSVRWCSGCAATVQGKPKISRRNKVRAKVSG